MGYSLMWNVDKTKRYVLENKFLHSCQQFLKDVHAKAYLKRARKKPRKPPASKLFRVWYDKLTD